MRYVKGLILPPILLLCALLASGCTTPIQSRPLFPPAADLAVEAKPKPTADIATSAIAGAEFSARIEAWGERGWLTVGRLCRYYKQQGMAVACPTAATPAPSP